MIKALLFLLAVAASGAAQYHTTGYFGVTWSGTGLRVDLGGKVTTASIAAPTLFQCEMDVTNRLVLVPERATSSILEVDPDTLAVVGTLVVDPVLGGGVRGLDIDHNGDVFLGDKNGVYQLKVGGGVTTVTRAVGVDHLTIDVDTGELLVVQASTLYALDRSGASLTTLAGGFNSRYGDMVRDPLTGDVYVPTCCGYIGSGSSLHRLPAGRNSPITFVSSPDLAGAYGPNLDRVSAARPRIVTGSHVFVPSAPNSGGVWYVDLISGTPTRLAWYQADTISDMTIVRGRNLQTYRLAPGRHDVHLSFPGEAGHAYVLAASLTGTRPALPLPDGRRVALVLDNLTALTLAGLAAPFVQGSQGVLDATGRARARIDVSAFLAALRGLRVWLLAATLDSAAPLGMATIADPRVLVLE